MSEQELKYTDGQPLLRIVLEFDPRQMPRKIRQVEGAIFNLQQLCPEAEISYAKKV
jgi:hypothetical protein